MVWNRKGRNLFIVARTPEVFLNFQDKMQSAFIIYDEAAKGSIKVCFAFSKYTIGVIYHR